jgi:hypothetical protein
MTSLEEHKLLGDFDHMVLDALRSGNRRRAGVVAGTRLPSLVATMYHGELTDFGVAVVAKTGCSAHRASDEVIKAALRLEAWGLVKRYDRYGYAWAVPTDMVVQIEDGLLPSRAGLAASGDAPYGAELYAATLALNFTPTAEKNSRGVRLQAGPCTVVRQLSEAEADREVGPMFRIRQVDGELVDAFADELALTTTA